MQTQRAYLGALDSDREHFHKSACKEVYSAIAFRNQSADTNMAYESTLFSFLFGVVASLSMKPLEREEDCD